MMGSWCIHNGKGAQAGFTLVETMISLVIGLLVVLGVTRVFIGGLESFEQVEILGEKQATISFASNMIIEDIRRADDIVSEDNNDLLTLILDSSDYCPEKIEKRIYRLAADDSETLRLERRCSNKSDTEPLASGFFDNGFVAEELAEGYWKITFMLSDGAQQGAVETVTFRAMNRSTIFK